MHFQNVTDAVYGEPELDPWIKPTVFGKHMAMLGDQGQTSYMDSRFTRFLIFKNLIR